MNYIYLLTFVLSVSLLSLETRAQSSPLKQLFIINVGNQTCGNNVQRITQYSASCKYTGANTWERIVDNGDGTVSIVGGCDSCNGSCSTTRNITLSGPTGLCSRDEQGNYIKYYLDDATFTYYFPGIPTGTTMFVATAGGGVNCRMEANYEYIAPGVCVNGSRYECTDTTVRRISCDSGSVINTTSFYQCLAPGLGPTFSCYGYSVWRYYPPPGSASPPPPATQASGCSKMNTLDSAYLLSPIPKVNTPRCTWPTQESANQCCAVGISQESIPGLVLRKQIVGEAPQMCLDAMDWFDCVGCDPDAASYVRQEFGEYKAPTGKYGVVYCPSAAMAMWDRCADTHFNISGQVAPLKTHITDRKFILTHSSMSFEKYLVHWATDGKDKYCYRAGDAAHLIPGKSTLAIIVFAATIVAAFSL
eukprot:TRINITY_DN4684_c0_g3_i1.p1 TRINITY_DN4684_c0_g3~~TRINITY_DN4684_c0_g3_i1.p1  ORF type:complete len:418 (+),score=13.46 TRINITY_DN4684_c0_g3_i1:301-1554(+)